MLQSPSMMRSTVFPLALFATISTSYTPLYVVFASAVVTDAAIVMRMIPSVAGETTLIVGVSTTLVAATVDLNWHRTRAPVPV